MTTIRERRHRDMVAQLARAVEARDDTIGKLVKLEAKVKWLRKAIARYEKIASQPKVPPAVETVKPLPPAILAEARATADDIGIPDFLARKRDAERRDAVAAEAIRAEQAEHKRTKSRNRIAEMKAKQAGDTRRMPLSGKAALEAIRQG